MTKKQAYKIAEEWLETHNKYRRSKENFLGYLATNLGKVIHILRGKITGKWIKLKKPKFKGDSEIIIIDEYTKEGKYYWSIEVNTALYVKTGTMMSAIGGPTSYLIIKGSGKIYLAADTHKDYEKDILLYLKNDIPENEWSIKPE